MLKNHDNIIISVGDKLISLTLIINNEIRKYIFSQSTDANLQNEFEKIILSNPQARISVIVDVYHQYFNEKNLFAF